MNSSKHRIKDIAAMAGVSIGTVDRVLHNRGNVSAESRKKVEEVLEKIQYQPNLLVASIGVKRKTTIGIILPEHNPGEYWDQVEKGIRKAFYDFSNIPTEYRFFYYDQFDLYSCRDAYKELLEYKCDAVIVGPTFRDETVKLAQNLDQKSVPYIFVDTLIPSCNQLSFIGPDSRMLGYMEAKLLSNIIGPDRDIVLLNAVRFGNEGSLQSMMRKEGFFEYFDKFSCNSRFLYANYHTNDIQASWQEFDKLFSIEKNIGGVVLFNSRSYIMAGYLESRGLNDLKIVGCGVTANNIEYLRKGIISFLLSERPEQQGFMSIQCILEHILYGQQPEKMQHTPIDILIKENFEYFV